LLLTPGNVRDLRRSLDEALDLGAQGITLLRPKGEWARANWPGFPSDDDLGAAAEAIRAFVAGWPGVRRYVSTAPPAGPSATRRSAACGPSEGSSMTPSPTSTAAAAGSVISPSPRKGTSSPARMPDSSIIAWATS